MLTLFLNPETLVVSNNIPSFLRIPLEFLEIILLGDKKDTAEFYEVNYFDRKQYNMIIASYILIKYH